MKYKTHKKGMIIAAIAFVLCIAVALSAVISLFFSKAPLTVSRFKRFQAINYSEAGLYEAFNNFRAGIWDPNVDTTSPHLTVYIDGDIDGVEVTIVVDEHLGRRRVSATTSLDDISL